MKKALSEENIKDVARLSLGKVMKDYISSNIANLDERGQRWKKMKEDYWVSWRLQDGTTKLFRDKWMLFFRKSEE